MTRGEWLDRLDELAAEHVLGWTWWTWTDDSGRYARLHEEMEDPDPLAGLREHVRRDHPGIRQIAETTGYTEGIAEGAEIERPMWCGGEYSRSISDAWKLVEKLCDTPGPNGDHHTLVLDHSSRTTLAVFDHMEEWEARAEAATPALAITLAALRAVGAKIPEEPDDE